MRTVIIAFLATLVGALGACGGEGDSGEGTSVLATTGIVATLVERVAGPHAEVSQLIPDGASAHDFQISASERQRLEEADLVAENGAGLEAGIPLDEGSAPRWILAEHAGPPLSFGSGGEDPHLWMDPTRVAAALPSLADALAAADPDHAGAYRRRAEAYARRLERLDREIARILEPVPAADRALVTSHDSLAYFADRYGFEVLGTVFAASGPEGEASAESLSSLADTIAERDLPAVFAGTEDDPEALRQVAEQTGVEVVDGLAIESPPQGAGYEEMLRRDAELIAAALAPAPQG